MQKEVVTRGGKTILIDVVSLAWLKWKQCRRDVLVDLVMDMAKSSEGQHWNPDIREVLVTNGRLAPVGYNRARQGELRVVLRDDCSTIETWVTPKLRNERGSLHIPMTMPDTFVAALAGRGLSELVETPFVLDAVIESATCRDNWLDVTLRDNWVELQAEGA